MKTNPILGNPHMKSFLALIQHAESLMVALCVALANFLATTAAAQLLQLHFLQMLVGIGR